MILHDSYFVCDFKEKENNSSFQEKNILLIRPLLKHLT